MRKTHFFEVTVFTIVTLAGSALAQAAPQKPETKGATAKILHEAVIAGPLTALNGKYNCA